MANEVKLFGFVIKRNNQDNQVPDSVVSPALDDGALNINSGTHVGIYVDLDGTYRSEVDLLSKYRTMAQQPEMENAIDDIINEAIVHDDTGKTVQIELDNVDTPDNIKSMIRKEFENILDLLDFNKYGADIFRRWYIDGRSFWNVTIDPKNPRDGIQNLTYIDPRRIRKIRNITKEKNAEGVEIIKKIEVFYLYNEKIVNNNIQTPQIIGNFAGGVKLSEDSVIHVTSGLFDPAKSVVLSYLHKTIRPMNQLRFIEDATVIYKVSRAPERRVFYIDTGNMPRPKAEQYLKEVMTKYRNKLVYDSGCFSMDTKVPLLDGRTLTIAEIASEHEAGKQNWVYSCDPITGKIVPGMVSWAGVTRKQTQVMRLTLDNGEQITCTPDHKFPVWDLGFKEAKDLVVGQSMIPHYTRQSAMMGGGNSYEQVFDNESKKWIYTHRMVSQWKDEQFIENEWLFDEKFVDEKKQTIHHRNYNRYDNTPENLVRMNRDDHFAFHKQHNSLAGKIGGKVTAEKRKKLGVDYFNMTPEQHVEHNKRVGKIGGTKSKKNKSGIHGLTPEQHQKNSQHGSDVMVNKLATDPEFNAAFRKAQSAGWTDELREAARIRGKTIDKAHFIAMNKKANEARWEKHRADKETAKLRNHKIIAIEYLDDLMDVGTLTIDKFEKYHNYHTFAISSGIFVKNSGEIRDDRKHFSMLEDFWIQRRSGDKATEITTLPAGQGFDNMDGVLYFEKKLYRALNVPVSRMETNQGFNLGRPAEITRDEIKFDKFVQKLRNRFSMLFDELLQRQLTLKGVCTLDEWNQFKQKVHYKYVMDNNFTELKEQELITSRVNTLVLIEPFVGQYFSKKYVQTRILQMDEDEIKDEQKQMDKEAKDLEKESGALAPGAPPTPPVPPPGQQAPDPKQTADKDDLNNRVANQLM